MKHLFGISFDKLLFSELLKLMVNKVTFVGFRGAIAPIATLGSAIDFTSLE